MDEETSYHQEEQEERRSHLFRRQEIIGAMNVIPIDMDLNDGCVLLDLVFNIRREQTMHMHAHTWSLAKFWNWLVAKYETDSNGRITTLYLDGNEYNVDVDYEIPYIPPFKLPPIIERLQKLKAITIGNCRLIPIELDNLPFLETLVFGPCPEEVYNQNIPEGMQLASLRKISLQANVTFFSSRMFALVTNLVSLEELSVGPIETIIGPRINDEAAKQHILHVLRNDDFPFRHSLKVLDMGYWNLKEEGLETLLFDILPRFPNLRELLVSGNAIDSLQMVASRMNRMKLQRSTATTTTTTTTTTDEEMAMAIIPNNSLRKLGLHGNSVITKMKTKTIVDHDHDHKERDALMTILNTFNEISKLRSFNDDFFEEYSAHDPDVEYLLRINQAGRKFITGGGGGGGVEEEEEEDDDDGAPPLRMTTKKRITRIIIKPELWPTILERAYETSDEVIDKREKCATGMYYMLRNGSLLQDIIAMRCDAFYTTRQVDSSRNSTDGSNDSNDSNDGNGSNGNGNKSVSSKR